MVSGNFIQISSSNYYLCHPRLDRGSTRFEFFLQTFNNFLLGLLYNFISLLLFFRRLTKNQSSRHIRTIIFKFNSKIQQHKISKLQLPISSEVMRNSGIFAKGDNRFKRRLKSLLSYKIL